MKKLLYTLTFAISLTTVNAQSIYNSQQIGQTGRNQNVSRGFWVKSDTALFTSAIWVPSGAGNGEVFTCDANGFGSWQPASVTTATNGTEFISSGVLGLGGALNRDTTLIEMNPFNQQFALEDSSASNKYHLIKGSIDGVPSLYSYDKQIQLRSDSTMNLRADKGLIIESDTGVYMGIGRLEMEIGGVLGTDGQVLTSDAAGNATWQDASGGGWGLTGNAGTTAGTNFIGTTDAEDFVIKTNDTTRYTMDENGRSYQGTIGTTYNVMPFASFRKDTASLTTVSVENTSPNGIVQFFLGSQLNTTHGIIPANAHYGAIQIVGDVYTGADTIFNHHLNLLSGSGNYEGINIFSDNGGIDFFTEGAAAGATMSIVSGSDSSGGSAMPNAGYVGIGIKRPQRPLTVYNTSPALCLQSSLTGTASNNGFVLLGGGGVSYVNYYNAGQDWWTNGTQKLTLTADGLLGVGANATSPNRTLHVAEASTLGGIAITNSTTGHGTGNGIQILNSGNDALFIQTENAPTEFRTNALTRWTMAANGDWTAADAINMAFNTTTGSKIGTATTQKIGFWNATPIVQPANTVAIDDLLVNTGLRASGGTANFTTTVTTTGLSFSNKGINTTSGDAATINGSAGRFRKDNSGATFTLTNSFITANSIIELTAANAAIDATAFYWTVSAGAGSATITFNAAPTADFDMNFTVTN